MKIAGLDNGQFLVRTCDRDKKTYQLSVVVSKTIVRHRIHKTGAKFTIEHAPESA